MIQVNKAKFYDEIYTSIKLFKIFLNREKNIDHNIANKLCNIFTIILNKCTYSAPFSGDKPIAFQKVMHNIW